MATIEVSGSQQIEYFDLRLLVDADWRTSEYYGASVMGKFLRWDKSASTDVVGYQVRAKKDVDPTDGDPAFSVGNVDFVDLTTVPALANADGSYHLSVKAVDDTGLTSPHARIVADLDFVPPDAPTNLRVTDS